MCYYKTIEVQKSIDNLTVTREGHLSIRYMEKKKYTHTKKQWIKWYDQKLKMMADAYEEVTPLEFYKDLFDGVLQSRGETFSGHGNAMVDIVTYYENQTKKGEKNERAYSRKYIMTNDYEALRYMNL